VSSAVVSCFACRNSTIPTSMAALCVGDGAIKIERFLKKFSDTVVTATSSSKPLSFEMARIVCYVTSW